MAVGQGNAGGVYAAIVKMDCVLANLSGDLPDLQRKRGELCGPQFLEHLLSFYFER
jgi:hypothetical protein